MSAAEDAPRRRSGRVAPKRKHTDYADLGGSSQDDSSEGEADEQELREKRRRSAKKPKVNGASVSLAIRPAANRSKKLQKSQKPRKPPIRKSALVDEEASGLYAEVFAHGNNLEDVAAQWVASFAEHEARAVAEVVNFVLRAAGCTIKITEDDIADPDNCPNRLGEIQDEYQAQDITDYPLLHKTRGGTAFKHALHGFFVALVQTIAEKGLLYENTELIENIEVWVSTMSSAGNRPFRHTSTVASLAIMSALARVGGEIVENTAKKIRQSEGESKKSRVNKGRVSAVNKEVEELTERGKLVDATLTDWFNTVYMHRYRDVDPHIRVECVEAMADWIMSHPEKFFDGHHLRYLGWVLSDPHSPTRVEVLKQLQKLFKDSNKLAGLKTFTERFRPRIVEIATQDAETNVRTAAIELLDTLRQAEFLEPDDIDMIGRLVFDAEPRVRKAVVGFFAETVNDSYEEKINEMGGQETLDEALAPAEGEERYENPRLEWLKLKCLIEQLQAYDSEDSDLSAQVARSGPASSDLGLAGAGIESRFYLATQVIYGAVPEVASWEVIAGYLLYDHSNTTEENAGEDVEMMLRQNCKLEESQETTLLDILNASVKIGLQRLVDSQKDRKKSKTQREADQEEQAEIVRKLSAIIPQLLKKFGAVPEAATLCLRLERELDLDVFIELRQTGALTALLDDVIRQFLTHHNERVLDEAIQSILHHITHEESQEIAERKVEGLWDELLDTFNVLRADQDIAARGDLPANVLNGLSNVILKISKLAQISDPSRLDNVPIASTNSRSKKKHKAVTTPPITVLLQILERGVPVSDVDDDVDEAEDALVSHAMKALLLYFVWKYRHCATHLADGTPIPDDDTTSIASSRDTCLRALMRVMQHRKGADELRLQAANLLLDTYNLFYTLRTQFSPPKGNSTTVRTPGKPQGRSKAQQADESNDDYLVLAQKIDTPTSRTLLAILSAAESSLAKRTHRHLEEEVGINDDPIDPDDEDPKSSSDEADDEEGDSHAQEEKRIKNLLAEGRLCFLGSRLVNAVQVGTLGDDVRKRLLLNAKLSHDWKEVVAHLDVKKIAKAKKSVTIKAPVEKPGAKSKEIVVESDESDEEEEAGGDAGDEIEDEEMQDVEAEVEQVNGNGAESEVDSVIGD